MESEGKTEENKILHVYISLYMENSLLFYFDPLFSGLSKQRSKSLLLTLQ